MVQHSHSTNAGTSAAYCRPLIVGAAIPHGLPVNPAGWQNAVRCTAEIFLLPLLCSHGNLQPATVPRFALTGPSHPRRRHKGGSLQPDRPEECVATSANNTT